MITAGQAADAVGVSVATIVRWHKKGLIQLQKDWIVDYMITRKDYFCRTCAHEWKNKKPWEPLRCPSCSGARITEIERFNSADMPMDRLPISVAEAARKLKSTPRTIKKWIGEGLLREPLTIEQVDLFAASTLRRYQCLKCGKNWRRHREGIPSQCVGCGSTRIVRA